jgi:hypothetical protein
MGTTFPPLSSFLRTLVQDVGVWKEGNSTFEDKSQLAIDRGRVTVNDNFIWDDSDIIKPLPNLERDLLGLRSPPPPAPAQEEPPAAAAPCQAVAPTCRCGIAIILLEDQFAAARHSITGGSRRGGRDCKGIDLSIGANRASTTIHEDADTVAVTLDRSEELIAKDRSLFFNSNDEVVALFFFSPSLSPANSSPCDSSLSSHPIIIAIAKKPFPLKGCPLPTNLN